MLHTVNSLTIRKYGEIDRTGNLSLLRKWYNVFPVSWFDAEQFFAEFREIFNINITVNNVYKTLAYNNILILDRIIKTLTVLMRNENERNLFAVFFKRTYKGINTDYYIEKIKYLTGIEIKGFDDLNTLQKEIQRKIDKYKERYSDKKTKQNVEVPFMDIVLGVFSIMEMAYIPEMSLSEFGRLKKLADKKVKAIERKNNG